MIEQALDVIIKGPGLSPLAPSSTHSPLLWHVAAVHVAFHHCRQELLWFNQLTSHMPGVLVKLQDITHSEKRLQLHLHAVKIAIEDTLSPLLYSKGGKHIPQWLVNVQLCRNAIDSILTLAQDTPLAASVR